MGRDEADYDELPRKKRYRCGGGPPITALVAPPTVNCYPGGNGGPEEDHEKEEEEEMDKLGVATDDEKVKTAGEGKGGCPKCGMTLIPNTNVPQCPQCGTKPFEKKKDG